MEGAACLRHAGAVWSIDLCGQPGAHIPDRALSIHLWVEWFFEVFATVVIGFLFTRLRLIEIRTATKAALFWTIIFLFGGIIGTFHHLHFAGATPAVIGLGAIFNAFEVVPLTLIGYEAWENIRLAQPTKKSQWIANYK
jgi:nitric oxide reductase subunit B